MDCFPVAHDEHPSGPSSQQDLINLRNVFDAFDENKDGFLSLEELCDWMNKLGLLLTRDGLKELIHSCDRNLDGRLDFTEFVELSCSLEIHSAPSHDHHQEPVASLPGSNGHEDEQVKGKATSNSNGFYDPDLQEAFRVFDKDGNGFISPPELKSTLSQLGLLSASTSFSRINSMIRRVDTDGDGQVSFSEFQSMMKQ